MNNLSSPVAEISPSPESRRRPRLGFLGLGWIGMNRLQAVACSNLAEIAGVADVSFAQAAAAQSLAPGCATAGSLEELLLLGVDGVVIATPSALHATQAAEALAHGSAVFCQKPLARSAPEARQIVSAARKANRLLGVDFSYRYIEGIRQIHALCRRGDLGDIYAIDLQFHNAYGPDKAWFYDPALSGGGCLIDLGVHLADLALWNLNFPGVRQATARLFCKGRPFSSVSVEDYVEARFDLDTGATVRLACSWNLPAGKEAVIAGTFYGTAGGAGFHNVNGSFYDFCAERFDGTHRSLLSQGPEDWGGRAVLDWVRRLQLNPGFDPAAEQFIRSAEVIDQIYAARKNNLPSGQECSRAYD